MVTISGNNRNESAPEANRAELVTGLVASGGFSRGDAQTIVDLAFHACDEAQRVIGRIAMTAEGKGAPACVIALTLALMHRVNEEFAARAAHMAARSEAGETRQ